MKIFATCTLIALLAGTSLVQAQTQSTDHAAHHTESAAPAHAMSSDMTEGEVRKIDKDAQKITLKHGPIKNLDMPGMTMVFKVKDATLFDKLSVGDKVLFTAEEQQGAFFVTAAEKSASK